MSDNVPRTLSQVLQDALDELKGEKTTLQEITDQLGVRAYGAFIVLLTLPNFIPGISVLSGALLLLFSIQMAMGIEHPWLPKFIGKVSIQNVTLEKGLNLILSKLIKIEHYFKPRLVLLSTQAAIRMIGIVIAFLSFVILLPIPFSNLAPSIALLFIAFGMLQKDGILTSISAIIGIAYSLGFLWIVKILLMALIA